MHSVKHDREPTYGRHHLARLVRRPDIVDIAELREAEQVPHRLGSSTCSARPAPGSPIVSPTPCWPTCRCRPTPPPVSTSGRCAQTSVAACQTVDFPIPASPSTTTAASPPAPRSRNVAREASSLPPYDLVGHRGRYIHTCHWHRRGLGSGDGYRIRPQPARHRSAGLGSTRRSGIVGTRAGHGQQRARAAADGWQQGRRRRDRGTASRRPATQLVRTCAARQHQAGRRQGGPLRREG